MSEVFTGFGAILMNLPLSIAGALTIEDVPGYLAARAAGRLTRAKSSKNPGDRACQRAGTARESRLFRLSSERRKSGISVV